MTSNFVVNLTSQHALLNFQSIVEMEEEHSFGSTYCNEFSVQTMVVARICKEAQPGSHASPIPFNITCTGKGAGVDCTC